MNTKATKLLAVLAVLAFAFAAFAVVVPAQEQDAAVTGTEISESTTLDTDDELAVQNYIVTATAKITIAGPFTVAPTFYVVKDVVATFEFTTADQTKAIKVMSAEAQTVEENTTYNEIAGTDVTFGAILKGTSFKWTAATTIAIDELKGAMASIQTGTAKAVIKVTGDLTVDGAIEFDSTNNYSGTIVLGGDTEIDIASGKTFKVINTTEDVSTVQKAFGISGSKLKVTGAGTLDVEVYNKVSRTHTDFTAFGIGVADLTIESKLVIKATGLSTKAGEEEFVLGTGISTQKLTLGPESKPTTLPTMKIEGNDRAIDLTTANALTIQNINGTFTGGEYAIRSKAAVNIDASTINAQIGTPGSNGLGETFGDGYSAIKADGKITVDKKTKLSAESILAKAGMDIKGESSVVVKYDAGAVMSNGIKYTGETAGTFTKAEAIKEMCGLIAGTYSNLNGMTPIADVITPTDVVLEKGSTLALESGCGIIGNVKAASGQNEAANIINLASSKAEAGNKTTGTSYSLLAVPMTAGGSSNLVFGVGSVVMDGTIIVGEVGTDYTLTEGKLTVNGIVEISGEIAVDIIMADNSQIIVPSGKSLVFDDIEITSTGATNKATLTILGEITGDVKADKTQNQKLEIRAANPDAAKNVIETDIEIESDDQVKILTLNDQFKLSDLESAFTQFTYVAIYSENGGTLTIDSDFKIPSGKTLFLGVGAAATTVSDLTAGKTVNISINEKKTLTVENAKVYDYSTNKDAKISVIKDASLILDSADVCAIVDVATDGYVNVMNPLNLDATGTPTSDISVGYGNTLTITKLNIPSGKEIYVYGNLIVEGTNTVAYGGKIFTYAGSNMTVNGSLTVEGTVIANGYTDIEGSVTVYRAGGFAQWATDNGFTEVYGSFDVTKARQDKAGDNTLTVGQKAIFYMYGTSTISGKLVGKVIDYGELTFNGASDNASIEIRDDVTLAVNSVTGTLTVTDKNAAIDETYDLTKKDYKDYAAIFEGNTVTLTNVKGLTISETVKVTTGKVKVGTEEKTAKYFVSTLSVTGTTSAATGTDNTVSLCGGKITKYAHGTTAWDVSKGCIDVQDITLGKNSVLNFASDAENTFITVSGTVTAIAEKAKITFSNTAGHVKVLGQIYVNSANNAVLGSFAGKVDATYYTYDSLDGSTNKVLEPFEKALESILTADDELIEVYGSQSVSGEVVIPATGNVHVTANSTLTIGSDAMITVEANAVLDASAGKLSVSGVLFVTDKDTGLRYSTADGMFVYQVVTESEQSIMYSGLAGALLRAQAGDVITMVQDGSLTKSATIPAGVTLIIPIGKKLDLGTKDKEMTLTVDGMLVLLRSATVAEKAGTVTILANGAIVKDDSASFEVTTTGTETSKIKMDNYVKFAKKIDGRDTTIYSNIEFAAATMDGGNLTVVGKVKGAAVTFAGTESEIIINVPVGEGTHQNGIAVFSMTLVNAKVVLTSGAVPGVFSGAIIAGSETGDAAITLSNATGVTIEAVTEETAAGDVDHFCIKETTAGTAFDGKIAITAGTITMNGDLKTTGTKSSVFWVTEDAIFVVASGNTFTVGAYTADDNVVVDGMMLVNGTLTVNGDMAVAGILTVVKSKTGDAAIVDLNKTMTVTGSVIVSEADNYAGDFNVNEGGKLVLGTAATAVGDGASFTGRVDITDKTAYIVAYPGADISDAKIDWNALTESSDAVSTEIYVFETLYATVFADSTTTVTVYDAVFDEDTVIEGYDIKNSWDAVVKDSTTLVYWFTDSAYKANMTNKAEIGDEDAVYFTPALAKVYGKVTVGVGITLYLDGKVYEKISTEDVDYLTVGKHTVSVQIHSGYVGDNVTLKFNGVTVPATATGGTITVTADMVSFTLVADGAEPYTPEPTPEPEKESEWNVTTILLCVLVVLIAIMAVIVALRLNRN